MLAELKAIRVFATSLAAAALRRALGRRPHPSWSVMYEATASVLRTYLSSFDAENAERTRRYQEGLTALAMGTPKQVAVETVAPGPSEPNGLWFRYLEGSPEPPGVLFYLHGGGYCLGSSNNSADLVARMVVASGADAFSLDYRLAPEHPYPSALEDAVRAYRWLLAQGVQPERMVLSGDSAGGGLAVALLLRLREEGDQLPAGAALMSPWVDLEDDGGSSDNWQGLDTVTPEVVREFGRAYLGGTDVQDPLISMVHADLSGLPPLLIQAGELELFRDQIQRFAERARDAGVEVRHELTPNMIHGWHYLAHYASEGGEAIEAIGAFARQRWAS